MRFHAIISPITNHSGVEIVEVDLRDFLGNKPGDGNASLVWTRVKDEDGWKFSGVDPATQSKELLTIADLRGQAKLLRAIAEFSADVAKFIDDPDAVLHYLIEKRETMLAVYDQRIGRYCSVNGLRKEVSAMWLPHIDGRPVAINDATIKVEAATEERAKDAIGRRFLELVDDEDDGEKAVGLMSKWVRGKKQVKREDEPEGTRPVAVDPLLLLSRKKYAIAIARKEAEEKNAAKAEKK